MAKVKQTDYLYLSTFLRARENSLLSREKLDRMAGASTEAEAARLLTECGYPDLAGASDEAFEEAFSARREEAFEEVEKHGPEPALAEGFRLRYDYHNAKVFIKSRDIARTEQLTYGCGRVPAAVLEDALREDKWTDVPQALARAMQEARESLARTSNPQLADTVLDKAYYAELLSLTETLSDSFFTDYVRLQIDAANLRSAVRCRRGRMDEGVLLSSLIEGGTVPPQQIAAAAYTEGVASAFASSPLSEAADLGQAAANGQPLAPFEKACENALTKKLSDAKRVPFGPAVAVGYLAAVEAESTAVRMVLSGKRAGLTADQLRERLRDCYV